MPPPDPSGGGITIYNMGSVPISFQLSGEGCGTQNFTIEPYKTTKYSCANAGKMTSVFVSIDKFGVMQKRKQTLMTGLNYFIAKDDNGTLLLGTTAPDAFLPN